MGKLSEIAREMTMRNMVRNIYPTGEHMEKIPSPAEQMADSAEVIRRATSGEYPPEKNPYVEEPFLLHGDQAMEGAAQTFIMSRSRLTEIIGAFEAMAPMAMNNRTRIRADVCAAAARVLSSDILGLYTEIVTYIKESANEQPQRSSEPRTRDADPQGPISPGPGAGGEGPHRV